NFCGNFTLPNYQLRKRLQAGVKAVEDTTAKRISICVSVKLSVGVLHDRGRGINANSASRAGAKVVENSCGSGGSDLVDRSGIYFSAVRRCSVKVAVTGKGQTGFCIRAISSASGEAVQQRERAGRRYFEYGAYIFRSAVVGRSVEIPVSALHQLASWLVAI